jgi:hypothetical protein
MLFAPEMSAPNKKSSKAGASRLAQDLRGLAETFGVFKTSKVQPTANSRRIDGILSGAPRFLAARSRRKPSTH